MGYLVRLGTPRWHSRQCSRPEERVRDQTFDRYFQSVARRGHAYPQPELYAPIEKSTVANAWKDLSASPSAAPVGVYVHLPFCERK